MDIIEGRETLPVVIHYERPKEHEVGADVVVTTGDRWAVAVGEYADQGEPDVLVYVVHAVDEDGRDIREALARSIGGMIHDAGAQS